MEVFLKDILENSPDIHYYYDAGESVIKFINPAFEEHFGIQPIEFIGKGYSAFFEIIHPEDRDNFEQQWLNGLEAGNIYSKISLVDCRCRIKSGKFLWYNNTQKYIRNKEGKITAITGCLRDITDLKVVEILKSTSKERLTMAMEAASDCFWEWKVPSNKLFLDSNFYTILGYEPYEFPDNFKEWENLMYPDDRKSSFELLKQCATGNIPQIHIEYRIRTKSNNWKWILCRAKITSRNEEGKVTKIIGTQTDITKLKEAEEEVKKHNIALKEAEKIIQKNSEILQSLYNSLKESEERMKLFFDEARNIAFLMLEAVEKNLIVTEFSCGGEFIFGIKKEEALRKSFRDVLLQTRNNSLLTLVQTLEFSDNNFKGEIPVSSITGRELNCLVTVHFIEGNENTNKKILLIITDIHERKEFEMALRFKNEELVAAEEELTATNDELKNVNEEIQKRNIDLRKINDRLVDSEEKFRELAENTNDAFWLRDEKNFLYINPSFENVWGRKKSEIFENPQSLEKWVHPNDRERFNKWTDFNLFTNLKSYSEQYRIIKSDGSIRWLWSRIHPVTNSEGKIYRLAGIATDITEQKEMEDALVRAKEKALESEKLKSAFLANISHEIRTPMNGILGFIELLNDPTLDTTIREQYIGIISKSSKQLLQIINDIIDISKIEANQVKIETRECNINTAIRDVFLFYQKDKIVQEKKNIQFKLELSLDEEFAKIITDESRLRQILMNILDNAFKFTFEGEIVMGYTIMEEKTINFYIKDTGIGIPQDQNDLIFKNFRQIDDSPTRRFGGTGLGLSISYGLAKLLGGNIAFESEVGKGTTFNVILPYLPIKKKGHAAEVSDLYPNLKNKVILVVEDDEINFDFLQAILEPTEAMIIHAPSGEDAIRIFSSNNDIDLILMDLRLPGISGYEAMKAIKNQNPLIPVVAQTAFAMAEDNIKCMEQGFTGYIAKPINRKLLNKIILEQLDLA